MDRGAGGLQFVAGNLEFGLFKALGGENGYLLAVEFHGSLLRKWRPGRAMTQASDRSMGTGDPGQNDDQVPAIRFGKGGTRHGQNIASILCS
jgi:hypothetical protein